MSSMPDPMNVLRSLQQAVTAADPTDYPPDGEGYVIMRDEKNVGRRFDFAKIIIGEVQAIAIFGLEEPVNGVTAYTIAYAVKENHRRRGLAVEAVNKGIKEMKTFLGRTSASVFYMEAVIDKTNIPSLKVAAKLFSKPGVAMNDAYTGTPSLFFARLITIP